MSPRRQTKNKATARSGTGNPVDLSAEKADPGAAKLAEIAVHWSVCSETARKIIAEHGLVPVGTSPDRYRWSDIWRLEGESYVPEWQWSEFKDPLLEPSGLVDDGRFGWSARSVRRKLSRGAIPAIRLSADLRRVRAEVAEKLRGCLWVRLRARHGRE